MRHAAERTAVGRGTVNMPADFQTLCNLLDEADDLRNQCRAVDPAVIRRLRETGGPGWERFSALVGWLDMIPVVGIFEMVRHDAEQIARSPESAGDAYVASVIQLFRDCACPRWANVIEHAVSFVMTSDIEEQRSLDYDEQIERVTEESRLENPAFVTVREAAQLRIFREVAPALDRKLCHYWKRAGSFSAELTYLEE